jgi:hypothetical protein
MVTAVLKTLQADGLQTAAATMQGLKARLKHHSGYGNMVCKAMQNIKFHSITHILGINIRAKLSFSSVLRPRNRWLSPSRRCRKCDERTYILGRSLTNTSLQALQRLQEPSP